MKLLTHNMLTSRGLKGVSVGYPLGIVAKDIKVADIDFNSEFIARIGHVGELPQTIIQDFENNEDFLRKVHHVLLEVEVINGDLVCPESGRKFPINNGIPNMLFNEDEV
ncbi:Similar to TRMT112: Multifunctional methyltransferase subunit TRM112-like protein (Bos taurus) [Cotesia congregata]|uniref:Multifunctional methyltransferase subunit TRM112-like protein n=1 Tax=Cotesia congregata TaxID=51543 RepID=A0A8J2H8S4_COTCN|nr:Similar to TRMT112: Multifunctional methyltransferase subunit TRM112-like protein (Bos taurus) [Cotesia congregata]